MTLSSPSTARFARINGIDIAFRVQGEGPPLVLIMGYRLSSAAWPAKFVETLAKNFTVITFDNRGTGVCTEKLNPSVVMVKSGQDGVRTYGTESLNRPRIRRIFV